MSEASEMARLFLRYPPVTHVHVGSAAQVVRVDALTIEEAREVIVRICDELEVARRYLHALRKAGARMRDG